MRAQGENGEQRNFLLAIENRRAAYFLFRFARGGPADLASSSAVVLTRDGDDVGVGEADGGAGK